MIDTGYLNECIRLEQVPKGIRIWKLPGSLEPGLPFYRKFKQLFNQMGIDYMKLIRFNTNYIKILEQRFNILHTSIVNNMFEHIYSEYLQVFENDDHAILSVMDRKKKKLVRDAREYHEERVYLLSTRNTDLNSNHRVNLDTRYQAPAENSRPPTRTSPRLAAK